MDIITPELTHLTDHLHLSQSYPLALCDATRLQSGDFISEITPNSHTGKPYRNVGDVEDITHSSVPFLCNQCEIPHNNIPYVLACGLLDYPTFGLTYFRLVVVVQSLSRI